MVLTKGFLQCSCPGAAVGTCPIWVSHAPPHRPPGPETRPSQAGPQPFAAWHGGQHRFSDGMDHRRAGRFKGQHQDQWAANDSWQGRWPAPRLICSRRKQPPSCTGPKASSGAPTTGSTDARTFGEALTQLRPGFRKAWKGFPFSAFSYTLWGI